jgi:hypothetical protein
MTAPRFCYLAAVDKGPAMLQAGGQVFVPIFWRPEDLVAFGRRCAGQLVGYRLYAVSEPADIVGFVELLRTHSLHAGLPQDVPANEGDATFTVLPPDALERALLEGPTGSVP